uniref:Uncharacterized protein n=1 Tax=Onchocerca volvulus TaxID=6282 RepID=A0A8R1TV32_ONCVO
MKSSFENVILTSESSDFAGQEVISAPDCDNEVEKMNVTETHHSMRKNLEHNYEEESEFPNMKSNPECIVCRVTRCTRDIRTTRHEKIDEELGH